MIVQTVTTYGCECGYTVDTAIFENQAAMTALYPTVPYGTCPSCRTRQLAKIVDLSAMQQHRTVQQADLDAMTVPDFDAQGQPVMVQTGEKYQLNPSTGIVETVPVMEQSQRPLTDAEKTDMLAQAQTNVDALSSVTVSETTIY